MTKLSVLLFSVLILGSCSYQPFQTWYQCVDDVSEPGYICKPKVDINGNPYYIKTKR